MSLNLLVLTVNNSLEMPSKCLHDVTYGTHCSQTESLQFNRQDLHGSFVMVQMALGVLNFGNQQRMFHLAVGISY